MIKSSAKVSVEETDEGTLISIYPQHESWQKIALGVWIIVWLISGMFMLFGLFTNQSQDQLIFFLVFMGFWVYFLFYAVRSLLWSRMGAEHIRINEENLDYKRAWGSYGKVSTYDLETMKNVGIVNYEDKTWAKTYNDAFWTIGGEQIGFDYIGKKVAFGFKLDQKQAKDIVKRLSKVKKGIGGNKKKPKR